MLQGAHCWSSLSLHMLRRLRLVLRVFQDTASQTQNVQNKFLWKRKTATLHKRYLQQKFRTHQLAPQWQFPSASLALKKNIHKQLKLKILFYYIYDI